MTAPRLRFVRCSDTLSGLIADREGVEALPFTPSHVECVVGGGYLGAHLDGGVAVRPVGYDAATLVHELFVDLPATDEQAAAFDKFVHGLVGAPYDWQAILDFLVPTDLHGPGDYICSAAMTAAARLTGALPYPLVVPLHATSPLTLLMMLCAATPIAGAQDAQAQRKVTP